jgi:predicted ATP-dependent protease
MAKHTKRERLSEAVERNPANMQRCLHCRRMAYDKICDACKDTAGRIGGIMESAYMVRTMVLSDKNKVAVEPIVHMLEMWDGLKEQIVAEAVERVLKGLAGPMRQQVEGKGATEATESNDGR